MVQTQDSKTKNQELSYEEVKAMIASMQKDLDMLSKESDNIQKKTGLSKEGLQQYMSNPKNFSHEDWKQLEKAKAETQKFRTQIQELLGTAGSHLNEVDPPKEHKKQKLKMLGMKKKNWIPM